MRVLICVLLLSSLIRAKILKPTNFLIDIGESGEKITEIFAKVATLNILLKNYEQPEKLANLLEALFGTQAFVIFNFSNEDRYDEWIEHCKLFRNDSSVRTNYYERLYQKSHDPASLQWQRPFDDFEPHREKLEEVSFDPQSPLAVTSKKLTERFAESLDKWFTHRNSGYILLCTFDELELYLGCLLNRAGTFLFIIERDTKDAQHLQNISAILFRAWESSTNLKLFVLVARQIFVLNPFLIDANSKSFGMLENLSDVDVNRKLKDLNGYPMNVELFNSAYSMTNGTKFTGKLDSFIGPDVEVARFIEARMNVSSNWSKKLIKVSKALTIFSCSEAR